MRKQFFQVGIRVQHESVYDIAKVCPWLDIVSFAG